MRRPEAGAFVHIRVDDEVYAAVKAMKHDLEAARNYKFASMNEALRELLRRAGVDLTGDTPED